MILNKQTIQDRKAWADMGIKTPSYDYEQMRQNTRKTPVWMHIGPGNIFRAFLAPLAQQLIEEGDMQSGITAVCTFDQEMMDKIYDPYDDLALQVIMHADGKLDKMVVASIGESLKAEPGQEEAWARIKEIAAALSLQMISFTITEKGYAIKNLKGEFYPDVLDDFANGIANEIPKHGMSMVAKMLYYRYLAGGAPIAVVSMDNCSHNGEKLYASVHTIVQKWVENHLVEQGFLDYVEDDKRVSFPWTMIDKITPRPDAKVSEQLNKIGFESTELVVTSKNTYIAPFVNAEVSQYLVVEDNFPNGRPPLEKTGVYFCDRDTVNLVERMKVCTCLNPLHTSLAIFGCLLGYTSIAEEMKDETLRTLVNKIGYDEGMPVVADPKIIEPKQFANEVITVRLPNPFIPDTPQRIACDTSQKLSIRFGETIKLYVERDDLDVQTLTFIPLTLAGWCRYLMGVDDNGNQMPLSPDPMLDVVCAYVKDVHLGDAESAKGKLKPILQNKTIFGVDLYEVGLGKKVEDYFVQMCEGKGAVRRLLDKEVLGK